MSTYEPGTVAKVTNAGKEMLAFRVGWPSPDWMSADVGTLHAITDIRPLVVLDLRPNQAQLLVTSLRKWADWDDAEDSHPGRGLVTSNAYRAAADQIEQQTRPPKPPEPTGLGAVVEDSEGEKWVRVNQRTGTQKWRCCDFNGEFRRWPDINAVRVLSEGVEVEQP